MPVGDSVLSTPVRVYKETAEAGNGLLGQGMAKPGLSKILRK